MSEQAMAAFSACLARCKALSPSEVSFGLLRVRAKRRRAMWARRWERLNSNFVLWMLTMLFASGIPFFFSWWTNRSGVAQASNKRRFVLALELYERLANAGAADPEDLEAQRERLLMIVDDHQPFTRPEYVESQR